MILRSGPITVVAVCVTVTCSYISEEVHVRLRHRAHGYTVPYSVDLTQNYKLAFS